MRLSSAINALVDANLAVITAVARGDHEHFDRLVAATEAKRDAAVAAGARYQRFLTQVGRADEAKVLAADLAAVIAPTLPVEPTGAGAAAGLTTS